MVCFGYRVHWSVMNWFVHMVWLLMYMDGRYLDMMYWNDLMMHWYFSVVDRDGMMYGYVNMV